MTRSAWRPAALGLLLITGMGATLWWVADREPRDRAEPIAHQGKVIDRFSPTEVRETDIVHPLVLPRSSIPLASRTADDDVRTLICSLLTLDEAHVPVPGATISVSRPEERLLLGTTDARGTLAVRLVEGEEVRLLAAAEGRRTTSIDVIARVGRTDFEVVLEPGATLAGSVRWVDGSSVGADVNVVATRSGLLIRSTDASSLHAAADEHHISATQPDGSFRIAGLDPRARYTVTAAAPGLLAREALRGVAAGRQDLLLEVGQVYGASLRLREVGGGRLRTPPSARQVVREFPRTLGARVATGRPELGLLGLTAGDIASRDDEILLLYVGDAPGDSFGPLRLDISALGYEDAHAEIVLPPVLGELGSFDVELISRFTRVGSLAVLCLGGPPSATPGSGREGPAASLRLDHLDETHAAVRTWRMPLVEWPSEGTTVEIPGLPEGDYRVALEADHGLAVIEPAEMPIVRVAGRTTVLLDAPALGSLLVEIVRADGGPYRGTAVIDVQNPTRSESGHVSFTHPPYRIEGLPPGDYRLRIRAPFPEGAETRPAQSAQVLGGAIAHVFVSVADA